MAVKTDSITGQMAYGRLGTGNRGLMSHGNQEPGAISGQRQSWKNSR